MSLPGASTFVTLKRGGIAGHAADGTPTFSVDTLWTKLGHYQQDIGQELQTSTGEIERQVYKFWLPFMSGDSRPAPADTMVADGFEYKVIGISQESFNHHLIVRAKRAQRA